MSPRHGSTWWGAAWLSALEQRARLDPNRLSRGKYYARSGAVRSLEIEPGAVTAQVRGSRLLPYDVTVRVRELTTDEWDRALDAVAAQVSHSAALLDGELPPELVADLDAVSVSLLPEAGEVRPRCTCPDDADPCKHAAAVCFLVGALLDRDPFQLLLLRGRTRDEILAGLRARRAGDSAELLPAEAPASEPDAAEGMDARAAFARTPAPLPLLPLPPTRPGRPSALAVDPPPGAVRAEDLYALAADAAARAVELLSAGGDAALSLTEDEDVVRRAAALLGSRGYDAFAKRAGIAPRALARRALAWQLGGRGALAVLDDEWAPDYADLAEGVAALGAGSHVSRNRVSDASDSKQLRLGRDGLWYPMRRVGGAWEISAPPSADPRALTARAG